MAKKRKNSRAKKASSPIERVLQGLGPESMLLLDSLSRLSTGEVTAEGWVAEADAWVAKQVQLVKNELALYDPLNLIAALSWHETMVDPETFKESEHEGAIFVVECASLLYLSGIPVSSSPRPITLEVLANIRAQIQPLYTIVTQKYGVLHGNFKHTPGDCGELLHRSLASGLMVRQPGYEHHQRQTLESLFNPSQDWMVANLGWTLTDLLTVEDAIRDITAERIRARFEQGQRQLPDIDNLYWKARRAGKVGKSSPQRIRAGSNMAMYSWVLTFLGDCSGVTADDIVARTGLGLPVVSKLLGYFSLSLGSARIEYREPEPVHVLQERPLIERSGKFAYPFVGGLLAAAQRRIEADLKSSSTTTAWDQYERNRAKYLEMETLKLLSSALRTDQVFEGLIYYPEEHGKKVKAELDGLVVFDRTLFLVEAKAGGWHLRSKKGEIGRFKGDVKSLIANAHQQGLRARDYLKTASSPVFYQGKQAISVDFSRIKRVLLIATTLENMDPINSVLPSLVRSGLMKDDSLPWAISLDLLQVISEVNEFPSQLLHYLLSRQILASRPNIYAQDELDWFGLYLGRGLHFDGDPELAKASTVFIQSQSGMFDEYYAHKCGQRKTPAPSPTQPMPDLLRNIIHELDSSPEHEGRSEVVLQLLSWGDTSRMRIADDFETVRRQTAADGGLHDRTIADREHGVTIFSCRLRDLESTLNQMQAYTFIKKYQQRAANWVGLLTVVDSPQLVAGYCYHDEPWEFDEKLELLAATLPDQRRV